MPRQKRSKRRLKMVFYYPIVAIFIAAGIITFSYLFEGGLAAPQASAVPTASLPPTIPDEPAPVIPASPEPEETPAMSTGRLLPYLADGRWGYKNTSGQTSLRYPIFRKRIPA